MFNLFKRFLPKKHELRFTKNQRRRIYSDCLEIIQENNECQPHEQWFCCHIIKNCCSLIYLEYIDVNEISKEFPELYKLKNKKCNLVWFKNNEQRIAALKKCIEQTKNLN